MIRVLFICLGNICRSPMAEAIFRKQVSEAGLTDQFIIDSAGTGTWHLGKPPHEGTRKVLQAHHIDTDGMVARQVRKEDLHDFEYIVAMDASNVEDFHAMTESEPNKMQTMDHTKHGRVVRMLDFLPEKKLRDVPDPYYSGNFDEVYEMLEQSCSNLLRHIVETHDIETN